MVPLDTVCSAYWLRRSLGVNGVVCRASYPELGCLKERGAQPPTSCRSEAEAKNSEKAGFTLIEIILVILIIGIITAVGIPRFLRSPVSQTEQFVGSLNRLIQDASELAQQTGTSKRILFNFIGKKVSIQSIGGKQEGRGIDIPEAVEISDALIQGKSAFALGAGEKRDLYFLINPEGLSQEVRLTIIDHKIRSRSPRGGTYEFYLNPFTGVFRLR